MLFFRLDPEDDFHEFFSHEKKELFSSFVSSWECVPKRSFSEGLQGHEAGVHAERHQQVTERVCRSQQDAG